MRGEVLLRGVGLGGRGRGGCGCCWRSDVSFAVVSNSCWGRWAGVAGRSGGFCVLGMEYEQKIN